MRQSKYSQLNKVFINRWSPRSFLSEPISQQVLETLFEAARWSPSAYNEQPWHFEVANTPERLAKFQSVLLEFNQAWANRAPVLALSFARRSLSKNGEQNAWAAFDTGAATLALQLQANFLGLVCHPMAGIHLDLAYEVCELNPMHHQVMCALAIGKQGPKEALTPELQEREAPNNRKALSDMLRF